MTDQGWSRLAGHDHTTAPALDLFDSTTGPELKHPVDDTKIMESKPAQETAEQWG